MVITLTFSTYLHDYDYVALTPVFVSMWWYSRQSVVAAVISLCLLMMLFIQTPESLNLLLGDHLRSAIVVMMGLTVAAYSAASVSRDNLRRVSAGVA
jgi:small neutral amino acid transporter SnatA (MarC family)